MSDKKKEWVMTEARQKAWEKCQAMRKAQCADIDKERQIKRLTAREKKLAEKKAALLEAPADTPPQTAEPTPPAPKKKVVQPPDQESESESDSSVELLTKKKSARAQPPPPSPAPSFYHVFL